MDNYSHPSQEELKLWINALEYQFVERKSKTDKGGWLRTIIAFANSNPPDTVCVLYIGANDDGSLEGMTDREIEDVMKSVGAHTKAHSWPPIPIIPMPLERGGKKSLAIVVPYSVQRPHFAGKAYVRRGTETVDASESQYEELVATRNTKTREILKWLGKEVTLVTRTSSGPGYSQQISTRKIIPKTCTPLFVTLEFMQEVGTSTKVESYPLHSVEVSFDNDKNRLTLIRYGDR
jgi:hypothetical protein